MPMLSNYFLTITSPESKLVSSQLRVRCTTPGRVALVCVCVCARTLSSRVRKRAISAISRSYRRCMSTKASDDTAGAGLGASVTYLLSLPSLPSRPLLSLVRTGGRGVEVNFGFGDTFPRRTSGSSSSSSLRSTWA